MEMVRISSTTLVIVLVFVAGAAFQAKAYKSLYCTNPASRCFGKTVECPYECPSSYSEDQKAKVCYIDCDSPMCKAHCKHRKPNCNSPGSACHDPRFIGGDGIVFYFHGKSNQQFSLVSDNNLQINGRFIGHRPAERTRDYTWIQALGILFSTHSFSVEATKAAAWDNQIDHLKFTHNGNDDVAEIMINVVPVTKEDDRIHNYQVPSDDCFAHLEVQFKFFALSTKVEGVLGRIYRPDFENPAKPGVAMPVLGGEDKYRTSSLLSADCVSCRFSAQESVTEEDRSAIVDYGTLDCTRRSSGGYGIVCKK
ncbi:hypothetical protein ACFX2B_007456 [Malus domestica]